MGAISFEELYGVQPIIQSPDGEVLIEAERLRYLCDLEGKSKSMEEELHTLAKIRELIGCPKGLELKAVSLLWEYFREVDSALA